MSFWKVLGGAAAGIACVVALPVAGPVGAITGVGALIAAGTGAAAGGVAAASSSTDDNSEQSAANYDEKLKKIMTAFEELEKRDADSKSYFDLILAMEAVGMSCAACNGHIAPEQRKEISEFTSGIAGELALPKHIKLKIQEIADNPPSIETSYAMAKKLNLESMEPFDEIIDAVMHADGIIHDEEVAFKKHWNQLKAAA